MNERSARDWIVWYLRQPFRLIVWFMETFAKNRERLKAFMARGGVAAALKTVVIVTFLLWLGVFAFLASKEEGDRLTCAVKSFWPGAEPTAACAAQPWQSPTDQKISPSSQ